MRFFHLSSGIFLLFGFANLSSFGLKFLVGPQQYEDLTGYGANSRKSFIAMKSLVAHDSLLDLVFTAPAIAGLGAVLTQRLGGLFSLKFAILTLFFGWMGRSIYVSFDKKATCRGAVPTASALLYFSLMIHNVPAAFAAWAAISFFYGIQESGGLVAAYIAFLAMI